MQAMIEDLKHHSLIQVKKAFTVWRQENSSIPTPADILKIIRQSKPAEKYNPPESGKNKKYNQLTEEGKALFDRAMVQAKINIQSGIVLEKPTNAVPWYGKRWARFTADDKKSLKNHILELHTKQGKERAVGYLKYLEEGFGVPAWEFRPTLKTE